MARFMSLAMASGQLLAGTDDGKIRRFRYDSQESVFRELDSLETRSSRVRALVLYPVLNVGELEMVIGDDDGVVTLFVGNQVMVQHEFGSPVAALTVFHLHFDTSIVVAFDSLGNVIGFTPDQVCFRMQLPVPNSVSEDQNAERFDPRPRAVLSCTLNQDGIERRCLLVSQGRRRVEVIGYGEKLESLQFPFPVLSMCEGRFIEAEKPCLVFGGADGFLYMLGSLPGEVQRFAMVGHPVTDMAAIRRGVGKRDLLACIGHFAGWKAFQGEKLVQRSHVVKEWVHRLLVSDIDSDGNDEIITIDYSNNIRIEKIQNF